MRTMALLRICVAAIVFAVASEGMAFEFQCLRCVIADWDGTGQQTAQCKDPDVYQRRWPDKSNCEGVMFCWSDPYAGEYCEPGCTGADCYWV